MFMQCHNLVGKYSFLPVECASFSWPFSKLFLWFGQDKSFTQTAHFISQLSVGERIQQMGKFGFFLNHLYNLFHYDWPWWPDERWKSRIKNFILINHQKWLHRLFVGCGRTILAARTILLSRDIIMDTFLFWIKCVTCNLVSF